MVKLKINRLESIQFKKLMYLLVSLFITYFCYVRVAELDLFSLWQDELSIYMHSQQSILEIINYSLFTSYHPPLLYLTLKPIYFLSGFGETELRYFHSLIGFICVLVPLFYFVRERKNYYLFYGLFLISNPILIQGSREALSYSLNFLLMTSFVLILEQFYLKQRRKDLVLLFAITLFTLFFNYLAGLLIIIALTIYMIKSNKSHLSGLFKILLVSTIFSIPYFSLNHLIRKVFSGEKINFWSEPIADILSDCKMMIAFININYIFIYFCLVFICYYLFLMKKDKFVSGLLWTCFLYITILLFCSFWEFSLFKLKYISIIFPLLLFALSVLISKTQAKTPKVLMILILTACTVQFNNHETIGKQDIRGAFIYIKSLKGHRKLYLNCYNGSWFMPYYNKYNLADNYELLNRHNLLCIDDEIKIKELSKLESGDIIFYMSRECNSQELENQLAQLNKKYKKIEYGPEVGVVELY